MLIRRLRTHFQPFMLFKKTLRKALKYQSVEISMLYLEGMQNDNLLTMFLFDITISTH